MPELLEEAKEQLERVEQLSDGKSAYEVAVDNGFVGTEAQWLASLHGAQGPAGASGPQGPAGADGQQGPAGADWVPTETELNDIAQRAVNLIPTTQGVLYGHYGSDVHAGDTITEAEATELLERDLKVFESAVKNAVKVDITQSQFDALVSLSYNIGTGAFADSDTVKALNEGKVGYAAVDIPSWRRGMGYQILPGLEKRRQTELEFFAVGYDFTITDSMNVRSGAGTNYPVKTVSQLTANGRENAVNRSASAQAVFREGTEITALEVKAIYSPQRVDVWFRCPSGWICARMGEEVNVK